MTPESLRILFVSYPLLPVSDESAGGAEQMLTVLERELHARGHKTTIAACDGSRAAGDILATGMAPTAPDRFAEREAEHTDCVKRFINEQQARGLPFDLVHDKSGHFFKHASDIPVPVLATLHLPRSFYSSGSFEQLSPGLFFNCVSHSQARTFAGLSNLVAVVENGVELARFPLWQRKRDYLLWMGRICEEKGTHVAIDVAEQTGLPLIIVGQVYPFSYHQDYFAREVATRLDRSTVKIQFVQKPSFTEKVSLLQNARALLIPALVDETSSLVAMEAMACGTPVVAFRRGALPEVVADAETGLIVSSTQEMAGAITRVQDIDPRRCRARVEACYDSRRMANDYEALYRRVLSVSRSSAELRFVG